MTAKPAILGQLWQLIAHPTAEQRAEMGEGRPFYMVMTLLLTAVAILVIYTTPSLHAPLRLIPFVSLMALHIALHWLSPYAALHKRSAMAYLAAQAVLAFSLVMLADSPTLSLALFGAMIGETIGTYGLTRLAFVSTIGYLVLLVGSYFLIGGLDTAAQWFSPTFSTMLLLIIFMVLYRKQLDASEQAKALLAELETAHIELADYAAQVRSLTLATERQRMARELHDTLVQGVAGLILQLEAANAHLENGRVPRAQAIIQQSMKRARSTLADARAAIDDLRLKDSSLAETIQRQADRFTQATGIPCHLTLDLAAETLISPAIADHAERIISESLTNVTRHAQAENVWLDVTQSVNALNIDVRDDGVGFDVDTAVRARHYGLLGMRERARLVNGTFAISSNTGEGTHLAITLPLDGQIGSILEIEPISEEST